MEIHNHGHEPRIHHQPNKSSRSAGNVDGGQSVDRTEEVQPRRLLERLEGDAKVRERLLVEVKAKFHAGEYSTRAAIEEAAQNIVE